MAGHGSTGSSTAQAQTNKMHSSTVKTMMLVSLLFTVSCASGSVYSLIWFTHSTVKVNEIGLYTVAFMGYNYTHPIVSILAIMIVLID